jgi:AraC-like DNA-binding protein
VPGSDSRTFVGRYRGDVRAKVLPFEEVNTSNPVEGYVANTAEPTPLESDMHHTFEVGVLLGGQEERHSEGLVRAVKAGDVWWSAAWEPHGWRTTVPPSVELVIHFVPELLGDAQLDGISWLSFFAVPPDERPVVVSSRTRGRVLAWGSDLAEEFGTRGWAWREKARCSLLSLLVMMGRESGPVRENWRWPGSPTSGLARIMPAIELVHADLGSRLPLGEAADACGLSPSWFRALFSTTMGMPYSRFEQRARLAHASRLLLGTDHSVEGIGEQTGFTDGSHLHRVFMKHYGCTPAEFRVQGRQVRSRAHPAQRPAL